MGWEDSTSPERPPYKMAPQRLTFCLLVIAAVGHSVSDDVKELTTEVIPGRPTCVSVAGICQPTYETISYLAGARNMTAMGLGLDDHELQHSTLYLPRYFSYNSTTWAAAGRYVGRMDSEGDGVYKSVVDGKTCHSEADRLLGLTSDIRFCGRYLPFEGLLTQRYMPGHVIVGDNNCKIYKYVVDTKTCRSAQDMGLHGNQSHQYCSVLFPDMQIDSCDLVPCSAAILQLL